MSQPNETKNGIIDAPGRSRPAHRVAEQALIVVGTGAVLYFFVMVTLMAWYFAGLYFVDVVFSWRNIEATVTIVLRLVLVAVLAALAFLIWGEYNYLSYAHLDRRRKPDPVSHQEVADFFDMPPETVAMAQASKFMSFHVEADEHILCDTEHGCMEVRKFDDSHQ